MNDQLTISSEKENPVSGRKKFDIYERALIFAARVAKFVDGLPRTMSVIEYGKQIIRSSGSVGANLEEADGGVSRKDFINKVAIARKEAKESRHWLRLMQMTTQESKELVLILSAIIKKSQI